MYGLLGAHVRAEQASRSYVRSVAMLAKALMEQEQQAQRAQVFWPARVSSLICLAWPRLRTPCACCFVRPACVAQDADLGSGPLRACWPVHRRCPPCPVH